MQRRKASSIGSFIAGAAWGAGLMYILDPNRGRTRRARVRDKVVRGIHVLQCESSKQLRNAGHHLVGSVLELRSSVRDRVRNIEPDILIDRVKAQLGRDVRHMRMLDFHVADDCLVVEGPVLRGEAEKIRRKLEKVRGVKSCDVRVEEIGHEEMASLSGQRGFSPQRAAM